MPTLVCPVCGTENPSTRLFCRKCASDLHATAVVPGLARTPPPEPAPVRPALIGAGIAALAILLLIGAVLVLGGSPAASPAPTASPSPAPSALSGPTLTPTELLGATPTPTAAAPTSAATAATPATPGPTPTDPPPIIRYFRGPTSVNCSDPSFTGTIHLSWRIGYADGVNLAIDGPGFYKSYTGVLGEDDVPFACGGQSHTYFLTTFGGLDPVAEADLIIGPAATP